MENYVDVQAAEIQKLRKQLDELLKFVRYVAMYSNDSGICVGANKILKSCEENLWNQWPFLCQDWLLE